MLPQALLERVPEGESLLWDSRRSQPVLPGQSCFVRRRDLYGESGAGVVLDWVQASASRFNVRYR